MSDRESSNMVKAATAADAATTTNSPAKSAAALNILFLVTVVSFGILILLQSRYESHLLKSTTIKAEETFNFTQRCLDCARRINNETNCHDDDDDDGRPRIATRANDYWVFYNLVRPTMTFKCNESVTFSTQGDADYLEVLEPLLERWRGPVSMAMFAPGDEFERTLEAIFYFRYRSYFTASQRPIFQTFKHDA